MRILLLMDPAIPVPPIYYGGIERVIADIANKYAQLGHEVTLVAGPNSVSPGRLITYGVNSDTQSIRMNYNLLYKVGSILYKEIPKHDVVHNFGRLAWLFPIAWSGIRKVQTYMRYITPGNAGALNKIGARNVVYTAVSDAIVKTGKPGGGDWRTVYNCAPIAKFDFNPSLDTDKAPLVFWAGWNAAKGRIAPSKRQNWPGGSSSLPEIFRR